MTQDATLIGAGGLHQRKGSAKGQAASPADEASTPVGSAGTRRLLCIMALLALGLMAGAVFALGKDRLLPELARCGTAMFTKLAGSMDDVVWLMPFLVGSVRQKATHGAVYCGLFAVEVCLCTAVTAAFAFVVGLLLPQRFSSQGWDVPCVMQLVGGALLTGYAYKLFMEWRSDDDGEDEEPDAGNSGVKALLVIGVLGSLDDMCLQATTLASGAFAFRHLFIGVMLGCSVVVGICWGASQLQCILKIAEFVPLWSVVAMLAASSVGGALLG